jgi:UDP-N-acetylmuramoyl-tripeptide--D-alanyl-D-alanine ligase
MNCQLLELRDVLGTSVQPCSEAQVHQLVQGITTDTRSLRPGEVFVALRGEKFDGHRFLRTAVEQGAIALVVETKDTSLKVPQWVVEDTLAAYQRLGQWWRSRFTIPVIGITGSVGKTTTKELMAAVLGTRGNVLKTQKNYNNEIGVPKTLLELLPEHDFAVIEMAMRARGEIAQLTEIARPTIGVITNVGTAHIGRLGSEEAIAQAKCELLATMSNDSIAVLNADNERLMRTAAAVWSGQTLTYGLDAGELRGTMLDAQTLEVEGLRLPLPLPGRHNASNFLAALAVAKLLQFDLEPLTAGITASLPQGRSQRYHLPGDIVLLDETYNAGLESMLAALALLKETPGKRHLAVLGAMKELGTQSPRLHRQVGQKAAELRLNRLLILIDDPEAEAIAAGAKGIVTESFATHTELVQRLVNCLRPGDRVLFKASNSVGLNRVVDRVRDRLVNNNSRPYDGGWR